MFLLGILFAWFILVPAAVNFLANFMPDVFLTEWTSSEYIGFILAMLFWLGLSFQMPIIVFVLSRVGLVNGPALRKQWRVAIVAIAVLAAAITPSIDPVTMMLTMAPLLLLYLLSIVLAYAGFRRFEQSMAID
jgi:sec-independent protein translocase protein TatC